MKRYIFPLLLASSSAFGQIDPADPFQTFVNEFSAANVAHDHAVASITPAIRAYQTLIKTIADDEVRMQTLLEWLKEAQAKEVK
jgi:hypothetical protein